MQALCVLHKRRRGWVERHALAWCVGFSRSRKMYYSIPAATQGKGQETKTWLAYLDDRGSCNVLWLYRAKKGGGRDNHVQPQKRCWRLKTKIRVASQIHLRFVLYLDLQKQKVHLTSSWVACLHICTLHIKLDVNNLSRVFTFQAEEMKNSTTGRTKIVTYTDGICLALEGFSYIWVHAQPLAFIASGYQVFASVWASTAVLTKHWKTVLDLYVLLMALLWIDQMLKTLRAASMCADI